MATVLGLAESGAPQASWLGSAAAIPTAVALAGGALLYTQGSKILDTAFDYVARGRPGKLPGIEYLSDYYAPIDAKVAERFDTNLTVEGDLPAALNGVFMRGGPNPFFKPTHGYHWFDGDGLLHATRIQDGKASYASHFIETEKLKNEKKAGKSLFIKFGDTIGRRGLVLVLLSNLRKKLGYLDVKQGNGKANTALTFHAGRLLTLHEADLPYQLRIACNGLIETVGRLNLPKTDGIEPHEFTAHPKIDHRTGEMVFIGYNMDANPFVKLGVLDKTGTMTRQWFVNLPHSSMMHDMAITATYVVLLNCPLSLEGDRMMKGESLPIVFVKERPGRIGLLRRDTPGGDATNAVRWFEFDSFMLLHTINAYETEEGVVKLFGCHFDTFDLDLEVEGLTYATPHLYTLDTNTSTGTITKISDMSCDFPVVHPQLSGYKTRWAWLGALKVDGKHPDFVGINKLDLDTPIGNAMKDTTSRINKLVSPNDARVQSITYPEGHFGGEPTFVPRTPGTPTAENEDDGFLLVYLARGSDLPSQLHVFDAKTMSSKPVAVVTLPQRVPHGFHGMFLSHAQMQLQKATLA